MFKCKTDNLYTKTLNYFYVKIFNAIYFSIIRSLFSSAYIMQYTARECEQIDFDISFDGMVDSRIKSNDRVCMYVRTCVYVCVVGFPKLYLTIPMQLGSDVMTVSPPQSSQLGRHTYIGRTWGLNTGVFIRVGFRMVYILVGGRGTLERAGWMHAIRYTRAVFHGSQDCHTGCYQEYLLSFRTQCAIYRSKDITCPRIKSRRPERCRLIDNKTDMVSYDIYVCVKWKNYFSKVVNCVVALK